MAESSRICVKNIGKSCKEAELRNLFAKCGEITDLKIMRRPDGSSRNFAFIGYRTPAQAQTAVKYFNNTFIGLSKLSVSIALKLGEVDEKTKLRKEKKATAGPIATATKDNFNVKDVQEKHVPTKLSIIDEKQPISKKKEKFLELALGKSKDLVTAASGAEGAPMDVDTEDEDDSQSQSSKEGHLESVVDSGDERADDEDDGFVELSALKPLSDLDYLRSKMVKKDGQEIEKVSMLERRKSATDDNESDSSSDESSQIDRASSDDDSAVDLDDLVKDPNAARRKIQKQHEKKESKALEQQITPLSSEEINSDDKNQEDGSQPEFTSNVDNKDAKPNCRLYVTNLPYNATEEEVRSHFIAALGNDESCVLEVHLPLGRDDKRGRGFGFVRLVTVAAAETAIHALHGSAFQGRVLHISYASEQQQPSQQTLTYNAGGEEGLGWSEFQKKKEEERRKLLASASNTDKNSWNASYVRSDAVLDTMSQRYQSSAGDLLDVAGQQGGDVAVRMALAETQVVMDNAAFLALHNISLDQSTSSNHNSQTNHNNNNVKRSDHMLLVKNLPADALSEELEAMFARYGALAAFSLAPNRTLAVAEFLEPSEARAAYKGLAYRRYRTVPLYLEWAPLNANATNKAKAGDSKDSKLKETTDKEKSTEQANKVQSKKDNVDTTATCSIFVKNLNFSTDETALRNHILRVLPVGSASSLRSVIIQKKQKRVDGPLLSLGYGFAEFSDRASAMAALGRLQGTVLDDHSLEAQLSAKKLTETNNSNVVTTSSSNRKPKTKLLVKNVAFQATKKEIRDLFSAHGVVTSVRLPKTMAAAGSNGSLRHRGFAFVDFATAQEAQNAKAALSHAHLYGRHLVIDFEEDRPENMADEDYPQGEGSATNPAENETAALLAGRKRAMRDAQLLETTAKNNSKRRKTNNPSGDAMAVDAAENKQMRSLL